MYLQEDIWNIFIFTDILLTVIIVILLAFIFEVNNKEYYKLKRVLKFAISLPGAPILTSFVDSLKIACNYEGE